jgi:hypothetical protein
MRELNARLRVAGLTDIEAKQLPTQLDATTFRQLQISTWRTDAGNLDVLADIPNRLGDHLRYEDLIARALTIDVRGQPAHVGRPQRHHRLQGVGQPAQGPPGPARATSHPAAAS